MTARPLRIGISCFPTFGGSGIVATEIGVAMARRGHRVHFIADEIPGRLDRALDNVFFHEVEVREYPLFHHSPYPLALASKMVEVCRREQIDLLHAHYALPHATSAYLARQVLQAESGRAPRVVTTLHGTDITQVGSDRSFLPITRFSILQSDAITVPSEYLRGATHEKLGLPEPVAMEVIPNFVDTARFRPPAQKQIEVFGRLFDSAAIPPDVRPAVWVHNSNFRPLKRVGDVVRAFALSQSQSPALLVLIGDGPDRSAIEALARESGVGGRVAFLGRQLDFLEVLQNADVFLLPSETESFGLAALEAMACGVVPVATRVGGVPELVEDGVTGCLAEKGDVVKMGQQVARLVRDGAYREAMAAAGRRAAETKFHTNLVIPQYEAVYERVLS